MASIIDDDLWCCDDCLMIVANDDASGMDDATEAKIRAALARIDGTVICNDQDDTEEFSHNRCDICNALAGRRHHMAILGD